MREVPGSTPGQARRSTSAKATQPRMAARIFQKQDEQIRPINSSSKNLIISNKESPVGKTMHPCIVVLFPPKAPPNTYAVYRIKIENDVEICQINTCVCISTACWSSGMILTSGARGPGFNSRTGPALSQMIGWMATLPFCPQSTHIGSKKFEKTKMDQV